MATQKSPQTFDQWLEQAKRLRTAAMAAEVDLLMFLVRFEEQGPWRDAGYNAFASLIRQYKLTRPDRYEEFKAARSKLGDDQRIHRIGIGATIEAGKIKSRVTRDTYVAEAELRVDDEGFPWSDEQAERARLRVQPDPPGELRRTKQQSKTELRLAEAEHAIDALQEENRRLLAENKSLRRQLGIREVTP